MTTFSSANSYWRFAHSVRTERRYIHTKRARAFLRAVLDSAKRSVDSTEEDCPFDTKRMKPIRGRAKEGRVNPKGIPYLYLATHRDTAVAEVRPWKGGVVSVGQFRVVRDLRLVNTT